MKKHLSKIILLGCLITLVGCQSKDRISHGLGTTFKGIGHLVLSPLQISAGLLEGISALPYLVTTNIHDINRSMVSAQQKITLHDTYDAVYSRDLSQVPEHGNTGTKFYRMKQATKFFQKVLKEYGVEDPYQYILTSVDTANSKGYTLFAVVRRPNQTITVKDKYGSRRLRTYESEDRMFYDPYRTDAKGKSLDHVIDWAGIPRKYIESQKAQAVLITLAANSVVERQSRSDYWDIEKAWMEGRYVEVSEKKSRAIRRKMNLPEAM